MGTDVPNHGGLAPCRHGTPKEGCHVCHLWTTSKRHRVAWGGPADYSGRPVAAVAKVGASPNGEVQHVQPTGEWTHAAGVLHAHHQGVGAGYEASFGVCHAMSAHALSAAGIKAASVGVTSEKALANAVRSRPWVTHCIVEAPFLPDEELGRVVSQFPDVRFVVRCHSQFGFMSAFTVLVDRLRWAAECNLPNVSLAFNSVRAAAGWAGLYGKAPLFLPNLYPFTHPRCLRRAGDPGRPLDVGSFGAIRPLKNYVTAAAAAATLAKKLNRKLRFHINVGRVEDNGKTIETVLASLLRGVGELVGVPWRPWEEFRAYLAAEIDICLHPSFTETFSIVTADAVAEGVPVVTSQAVDWLPDRMKADPDDPVDIAGKGAAVLADAPATTTVARDKLRQRNAHAVYLWEKWLSETKPARTPKRERRTLPCVHLGDEVGHEGSRTVYECDAGHGSVRSCIECQRCGDYVAKKD